MQTDCYNRAGGLLYSLQTEKKIAAAAATITTIDAAAAAAAADVDVDYANLTNLADLTDTDSF